MGFSSTAMPGDTTRADRPPSAASPATSALRLHRARRRLGALAWRLRFFVVAVCCGLAATSIVSELRPAPPPTVPLVVTTGAVDAGTVLREADLALVHVPVASAPDEAFASLDEAVGRTASVALPAGLTVVRSVVAADDLAASAPPGTVVAPVRLADPSVAALLSAGDHVDLLVGADGSAGGGPTADLAAPSASSLARRAVVLPGFAAPEKATGGGLLGGGANEDEPGVTLFAVLPEEAARLANVTGWGAVTAVLVP